MSGKLESLIDQLLNLQNQTGAPFTSDQFYYPFANWLVRHATSSAQLVDQLEQSVRMAKRLLIIDGTIQSNTKEELFDLNNQVNNYHIHVTFDKPIPMTEQIVQDLKSRFKEFDVFNNVVPFVTSQSVSNISTWKVLDGELRDIVSFLTSHSATTVFSKSTRVKIEAQHPIHHGHNLSGLGYCEGHITTNIPTDMYIQLVKYIQTEGSEIGLSVKVAPTSNNMTKCSFSVRSVDASLVGATLMQISMILTYKRLIHKMSIEYVVFDSNPHLDSAWLPFIKADQHEHMRIGVDKMFASIK